MNKTANITAAYSFESYAYGNPNEDSDLDIFILTNDKSNRKIEIVKIPRKAINKIQSFPVDLIIYYDMNLMKDLNLTALWSMKYY
ncbi:nucleotidyltransferase domain-containing protein [Clostridium sp. LS]|uniref:nucleotidyltransferase domain-containing protein n=1 Tax=Clostridium sp. Maddingley MBC34-26 TaxID=1196322 RepID=UPI000C196A8B